MNESQNENIIISVLINRGIYLSINNILSMITKGEI